MSRLKIRGFVLELRKFKRLSFFTKHTNTSKTDAEQKRFAIDGFTDEDAMTSSFMRRVTQKDGTVKEVRTSVADYFRDEYKIRLQFPKLPCVKTKRAGNIPMELCFVDTVSFKSTLYIRTFTRTNPCFYSGQ